MTPSVLFKSFVEIVYNKTAIKQFDENIPFTLGIEQCTSDTTCDEVPHQFSAKLSLGN